MALPDYLIPLASILVPIGTLFVVRTLDKGSKRKEKFDTEITEIHSFVETNRTLIARLVENIDKLDERMRVVERDISRLFGKINGRLTT